MLRREVMRMGAGLFGLGTGTPSRFPYKDRPQPSPGIGPSQGQVIRARQVIVFGPGGGIFVYSGTPALGNLIETDGISVPGTDPHGNAYLQGQTTYTSNVGTWFALQKFRLSVRLYESPSGPGGPYIATTNVTWQPQFVALGNVTSTITFVAPSGDMTGATDPGIITTALGATSSVVMLPGVWYFSSPVNIPPASSVEMAAAPMTLGIGTPPAPGSNQARVVAVASWAPSSPAGVFQFLSQTPGGWAVPAQQQSLRNVVIDCSQNASSNLNGIWMEGPCYDTRIEDVYIWQPPHDGITAAGFTETGIGPTFPYHQRWTNVTVADAGFIGFQVTNFTDSTYQACMSFAAAAQGWFIQNCSNSQWLGCRSEWNTGEDFEITGASGSLTFSGCTTDAGYSIGLYINNATGQANDGGGIIWTGGKIHGPGLNGGAGDFGVKIVASTVPVSITGLNVEITNGSHGQHPATALSIDAASANVIVDGCMLQGITTSWASAGSVIARSGCIGATGAPGAQVFTRLADI